MFWVLLHRGKRHTIQGPSLQYKGLPKRTYSVDSATVLRGPGQRLKVKSQVVNQAQTTEESSNQSGWLPELACEERMVVKTLIPMFISGTDDLSTTVLNNPLEPRHCLQKYVCSRAQGFILPLCSYYHYLHILHTRPNNTLQFPVIYAPPLRQKSLPISLMHSYTSAHFSQA